MKNAIFTGEGWRHDNVVQNEQEHRGELAAQRRVQKMRN